MIFSRREFLKAAGLATAGAVALPAWVLEAEAAVGARFAEDKNKVADAALSTAQKLGASYADVRINRYRYEDVFTRERQVQNVSRTQDYGFGVRVIVDGTWGFAASPDVTEQEARRVTAKAVEIAKANSAFQRQKVRLVPVQKVAAKWRGAFESDPFDAPVDDKIQFLLKLNEEALKQKGVGFVDSSLSWVNEQKFLATSDGARIDQYTIRGFPEFNVTATDASTGDFQTRRSLVGPQAMGLELLKKHDWLAEARQAGEEAVMKLSAKPIEPGKYDLVLHPSHLWLTIHESVGHSTELDRALWWEANYAGTSFLTPDKLGKLQFGSKIVNFFADRTQPAGLATVGYDDEAVPGQKWHLVKDGTFVDWQTTRDLAALLGRDKSYGCLHAQSWSRTPFPRMPNVSLEPAKENVSQNDLIAGVERGILVYGDGSYSIDQQRYNFQFGGQTFWEIKNGKVAGMLRDVAYQSRTTDFWGACDALGGQNTYLLGGSYYDGKGEPGQINAVSHGCPSARFRQINVLNTAAKSRS
jgi:TldD protein